MQLESTILRLFSRSCFVGQCFHASLKNRFDLIWLQQFVSLVNHFKEIDVTAIQHRINHFNWLLVVFYGMHGFYWENNFNNRKFHFKTESNNWCQAGPIFCIEKSDVLWTLRKRSTRVEKGDILLKEKRMATLHYSPIPGLTTNLTNKCVLYITEALFNVDEFFNLLVDQNRRGSK